MLVYGFVYERRDRPAGLFIDRVQCDYYYKRPSGYAGKARNITLMLDKDNRIRNPMILPYGKDGGV